MNDLTKTVDITSPYDGSIIKTIPMHTKSQATDMLDRAYRAFKDRNQWLEPYQRIEILEKLGKLVEAEKDEFALLIAKEGGKPLMDAKVEVARAIDGIYLAVKELAHICSGKEVPMGHTQASINRNAHYTYEPIGVVVAVSAFNHPLNLIIHQVIPAIAVGCPVIIKPASATPLNCLRFIELVHQAGLPKDWAQACICDNDVAEMLVTSEKIGFFSFIGSARVGWWLKSKLAPGVRCALEHGGVAPAIVDKDVKIDDVITSLTKGGFYHAGQVCVSTQRVYVEQSIIEEVADKLTQSVKKLVVGDPTDARTEVGPLIQTKEVDRVDQWVNEAISAGAKCLAGGKKISDTVYEPTILLNPPSDANVSTKEVFGPVICLYPYTDYRQAIECANSLDVAFQAAVYTQSLAMANHCISLFDATAVMVNDHTAFRVDWMPFAGRRHSGYGIGGIGYTMHDMIQIKMAVIKNI
ncbi:aldehyde dehydrogenase family protein [Thiotrichales bacterium 19S3-7]|nr:aldehyde dehydrogenase family protein [Thiotrichales bacterium 19S3-7]MCF6802742.1 aldehyde dehydrogenase family protein [Thiotrichales bacterium 19S3-11]